MVQYGFQLLGTRLVAQLRAGGITDEEYNNYGINFGGLGAITAQYGEPLTYGLDVTFEF